MKFLLTGTVSFAVLFVSSLSLAQELKPEAGNASESLVLEFYSLGELVNSIADSSIESVGQTRGSSPPSASHLGGGGGGMGGAAMGYGVPSSNVHFSNDRHATLMELIVDNVDRASWEGNGEGATILSVKDSLLIRQTADNHALIKKFLKNLQASIVGGQPLAIEIWWLPLNSGVSARVKTGQGFGGKWSNLLVFSSCFSVDPVRGFGRFWIGRF